jgi:serine protease Do
VVVRKLCSEGILTFLGTRGRRPQFNEIYHSGHRQDEELAYQSYDFIAFGFPAIRQKFSAAVRPVFVESNGAHDVGTAFWIGDGILVTAAHCVKDKERLKITGPTGATLKIRDIGVPVSPHLDLCVIRVDEAPFARVRPFAVREGEVLERVMTMGYPQIQGFPSTLITETTEIAGFHVSTGEIVAEEQSYLDQHEYQILSARVKGGSSGGPVVAQDGRVVGIVFATPGNSEAPDVLGYGLSIPAKTLKRFLGEASAGSDNVNHLRIIRMEDGVSTVQADLDHLRNSSSKTVGG